MIRTYFVEVQAGSDTDGASDPSVDMEVSRVLTPDRRALSRPAMDGQMGGPARPGPGPSWPDLFRPELHWPDHVGGPGRPSCLLIC
jgi:hypothetical protein